MSVDKYSKIQDEMDKKCVGREIGWEMVDVCQGNWTGERRIFRKMDCQGSWMQMGWRGSWIVGVVRDIGGQ